MSTVVPPSYTYRPRHASTPTSTQPHVCTHLRLYYITRTGTSHGGPRDARVDALIVPVSPPTCQCGPPRSDTRGKGPYFEWAATTTRAGTAAAVPTDETGMAGSAC